MCQKVFKIISPVVPTFNRNEKQKRKDQRKLYRYLKHQHGIVLKEILNFLNLINYGLEFFILTTIQ
jgi:hypothetical protein